MRPECAFLLPVTSTAGDFCISNIPRSKPIVTAFHILQATEEAAFGREIT